MVKHGTLDVKSEHDLQALADELEKRLQANIIDRQQLNNRWLDYVTMAIDGKSARFETLSNAFTDIGNVRYPASIRLGSANRLAFLDSDFFQLTARNDDDSRLLAFTERIRDDLNDSASNFHRAMEMFDLQLDILNISAITQTHVIEYADFLERKVSNETGKLVTTYKPAMGEIEYQGPRFQHLNMFNVYPDIYALPTNDLNDVDVYYQCEISYDELMSDSKYNPDLEHGHIGNVLHKGLNAEDIDNIKTQKCDLTDYEIKLNSRFILAEGGTREGTVRLKIGYLKNFVMDGKCLTNVVAHWITLDGTNKIVFLAKSHFAFRNKPVRLMAYCSNPFNAYGTSPGQVAYNSASYSNYLRMLESRTVNRMNSSALLVPGKLMQNILETSGMPTEKIRQIITGERLEQDILTFNDAEVRYSDIKSFGENNITRDLSVISSIQSELNNDLTSSFNNLSGVDLQRSTATGINADASNNGQLNKRYLKQLSMAVLKPILKGIVEDYKVYLLESQKEIDLSDEDLEALEGLEDEEKEMAMQAAKEAGMKLDAESGKATVKLAGHILAELQPDINIQIEGFEYTTAEQNQNLQALFAMLQGMEPGKAKSIAIEYAIGEFLRLSSNPLRDKILKELKQARAEQEEAMQQQQEQAMQIQQQQMAQQQQQQEAGMQVQAQEAQTRTGLQQAQAAKDTALAGKHQVEAEKLEFDTLLAAMAPKEQNSKRDKSNN